MFGVSWGGFLGFFMEFVVMNFDFSEYFPNACLRSASIRFRR